MMVSIGIDAATDLQDCFILNAERKIQSGVFTIPNSMVEFICLLQRIQDCTTPQGKIKVGLETTGHCSYNTLEFLSDKSYRVPSPQKASG